MRIALFVAATALASGCATRLPPVSASAPPELRIWHTVALLDDGVEGVVVTPGVVRFYAGPDRGSVKLVDMVRTPHADDVLDRLDALREHDGTRLACSRVKDGGSLEVEGISFEGPFRFIAVVPSLCEDGPPKDVFDMHSRLMALRQQSPR